MLKVEVIGVIEKGKMPEFKVKDVNTNEMFNIKANVDGGYTDQHGRTWTHKERTGNIHIIEIEENS